MDLRPCCDKAAQSVGSNFDGSVFLQAILEYINEPTRKRDVLESCGVVKQVWMRNIFAMVMVLCFITR